jgi:DnaJ-class molecular chaperone
VTCGSCNGTGQKKVPIFNTITQKWTTLTESCLSCNGSGQAASR